MPPAVISELPPETPKRKNGPGAAALSSLYSFA